MNSIKKVTAMIEQHNKTLRALKNIISVPIKPGRNEKCNCGSGKKFKHCCINK